MRTRAKGLDAARYHARRGVNDNLIVLSFHEWMVKGISKPIARIGARLITVKEPFEHDTVIGASEVVKSWNTVYLRIATIWPMWRTPL